MLRGLIRNAHRIHEFTTDILVEYKGTFMFHGPVFSNLNMLNTSDPENIHHHNVHIVTCQVSKIVGEEVIDNALRPTFDVFAEQGTVFDLQDIFHRFGFDVISKLLLDHDPKSLSLDLPHVPCEKAFTDASDALLYRHILPEGCWKLLKWLQIGTEKKLSRAWEAFDQYLYPCISRKLEKLMNKTMKDEDLDVFTSYIEAYNQWKDGDLGTLQTFLRDTFLSLIFAGRDTSSTALTWFFWMLSKNPLVEKRIREEIQQQLHLKEDENLKFFKVEETRKLVYLQRFLRKFMGVEDDVEEQVHAIMDKKMNGYTIVHCSKDIEEVEWNSLDFEKRNLLADE
ncbi:hypothetical protein BC332_26578 [Capsicum chinense]|nr:hypothetical protein BC332_26578 [Capsicum chinense]